MVRQNIVYFSGAGIGAERGIPTFRDADGFWNLPLRLFFQRSSWSKIYLFITKSSFGFK